MSDYKRYKRFTPLSVSNITSDGIEELCDEDQRAMCLKKGTCSIELNQADQRAIAKSAGSKVVREAVNRWREHRCKKCKQVMVVIGEYNFLSDKLELKGD